MKKQELDAAIAMAFEHDTEVIVEETINGFEVGCAVLGIDELTVGRVDEIELSNGFFDYTENILSNRQKSICLQELMLKQKKNTESSCDDIQSSWMLRFCKSGYVLNTVRRNRF